MYSVFIDIDILGEFIVVKWGGVGLEVRGAIFLFYVGF